MRYYQIRYRITQTRFQYELIAIYKENLVPTDINIGDISKLCLSQQSLEIGSWCVRYYWIIYRKREDKFQYQRVVIVMTFRAYTLYNSH